MAIQSFEAIREAIRSRQQGVAVRDDRRRNRLRNAAAGLALLLAAASESLAGDESFVIAPDGSALGISFAEGSTVESVDTEEGGTVLRWTSDGKEAASLSIRRMPGDIRPYRTLHLRVRAPRCPSQRIYVRLRSEDAGLEDVLPAPAPEWMTLEILLPGLPVRGDLDPATVEWLQLATYQPGPFTLEIADVRLAKAEGGWRWTPEEEKARGDALVLHVADFEGAGGSFSADQSEARVEETAEGHALRWIQPERPDGGWITIGGVPTDITGRRLLRLKARTIQGVPAEV